MNGDSDDDESMDSPDLDKLDGDGDYIDYESDNDDDNSTCDKDTINSLYTYMDDDSADSDYVEDGNEDQDNMNDESRDEFGPLQYRDASDHRFLLGFELRHFDLDHEPGTDTINLRMEETTPDETILHDNLVMALVNALHNSSTKSDKLKGKQLEGKLKEMTPNKIIKAKKKAHKEKKEHKEKKAHKKKSKKIPTTKKGRASAKAKDIKKHHHSETLKLIFRSAVDDMG
ncbi:hypothetical protein BC941DRAFT_448402 [Chlamydoabsidia padenii]|nr:hypothetical protein BC941DRAFT_448402 [Chlamydoabsidia padenii]